MAGVNSSTPVIKRRETRDILGTLVGGLATRREMGPLVALILLAVAFQGISGRFFIPTQIEGLTSLGASIAIVAAGVTLLMVAGEFDLSVGSTYALGPIAFALLLNRAVPDWLALAAAVALCASVGLANGIITTRFGIPSLITTLAAAFGILGLDIYAANGGTILFFKPSVVMDLLGNEVGGLPIAAPLVWAVIVTIVCWFLLEWTKFGSWTSSAGGREE